MSAFHHKALLIESVGQINRYRFFPAHLDAPDLCGTFCLKLATLEWSIETASGHANERRAVAALVHKIKKAIRDGKDLPETILFVG